MGFWSKLARLLGSPEESELEPEETPFAHGSSRTDAEPNRAAEGTPEGRRERNRLSKQLAQAEELARQAEQERQALLQERADRARENEDLRVALEKQQEELGRLTAELDKAQSADVLAAEDKLAEAGRLRDRETAQAAVQQQLQSELREALAQNTKFQSEVEKLRATLANNEAELQRVNAERQRLLNEYGQQCMELIGLQKTAGEVPSLKGEITRLQEESEQARGAATAAPAPAVAVPARTPRKQSETAELARRDEEIRRLNEHIAKLEKELASRGTPLPLSALPPPLQQILTHMGSSVDPQRIVTDLWERLMELEARFNAARDDTNRRMGELATLRTQLAELYGNIITPITVLSATADLLAMRQDMPKGAQTSLDEMKQFMATVRQAISRMQKITTTGRDKE